MQKQIKKEVKTSDKIFRVLVIFCIITLPIGIGLTIYNKSVDKRLIRQTVVTIEEAFEASATYSKGSNRIIVKKYLKDEKELYELTRNVLPHLSVIGEYDIVEILSFRAYYGETKDNFQFYDIKFKNIGRIDWDRVRNFDDFLSYLNYLN